MHHTRPVTKVEKEKIVTHHTQRSMKNGKRKKIKGFVPKGNREQSIQIP
jgi:hypothetical protein